MSQVIIRTTTLENTHFRILKSFPVRILNQFLIHTKTYDANFLTYENRKVIGNSKKS